MTPNDKQHLTRIQCGFLFVNLCTVIGGGLLLAVAAADSAHVRTELLSTSQGWLLATFCILAVLTAVLIGIARRNFVWTWAAANVVLFIFFWRLSAPVNTFMGVRVSYIGGWAMPLLLFVPAIPVIIYFRSDITRRWKAITAAAAE